MNRGRFFTGYHEIHPDPAVNFQLNRWISYLGVDALEDFRSIASRLTDFKSYIREFEALGDKALAENRKLDAAYCYRSAEFFMGRDNSEKNLTREKFLRLVREHFNLTEEDYCMVPYTDGNISVAIPALRLKCSNPKDTLLIFGGSDSYIEEFMPIMLAVRDMGYDIVCFEGPGQGSPLENNNLKFTHHWHKPVAAVLNYFNLDDVTAIGISMGGCLVLRAAAYEKRIRRAIAYDICYNASVWLSKLRPIVRVLITILMKLKAKSIFNCIVKKAMSKSMQLDWGIRQGMHIIGPDNPFDYFVEGKKYTTADVSHLVDQDVLLMAGQEDFAVDIEQFYRQIEALKNVRSLTARMFTRAEQAHNHCQIGNLPLAMDVITSWIDLTKRNMPEDQNASS